jgi:hypothetical protein
MIDLSYANYRYFSPIPLADGSRNSLPTRSTTGPIWSGCSRATLKGPTYVPVIHGTSASASKNQRETLREYARRFSKQCTELPHIPDHDVILAFVSGTACKDLLRELGLNRPQTVDELMDVAANYTVGEEAVDAFFSQEGSKGKEPMDDDEGPSQGSKKSKKKKKARLFKREALDDNLVAAAEHKKPRGPPEGAVFDKMLKEPCPYHKGGANHKLEDYRMLKRYFDGQGLKKGRPKERTERREGGEQRR